MGDHTAFAITRIGIERSDVLVAARRHMYEDMGETNHASLDASSALFSAWLPDALAEGRVLGFVAENDAGEWLGALSAHVQNVPPSLGNPKGRQHYLFGLWVRPEARRRGVATSLVNAAIEAAKADGAGAILLMASDAGRPLYEGMGFEPGAAMRLFLDPLP